jgi:hypothetical protein
VSAIIGRIASGERLITSQERGGVASRGDEQIRSGAADQECKFSAGGLEETKRSSLVNHPALTQMMAEQVLTPDEALEAANAIDRALGRYLTGTRYAVP